MRTFVLQRQYAIEKCHLLLRMYCRDANNQNGQFVLICVRPVMAHCSVYKNNEHQVPCRARICQTVSCSKLGFPRAL